MKRAIATIGWLTFGVQASLGADDLAPANIIKLNLTAKVDTMPLYPGQETTVWRYVVSPLPPSAQKSHFPVIYVKKGQILDVTFKNGLSEPTSVHWHGLDVPASMDGHPADAIKPGGTFRYRFVVPNRAGTYWFHPHPDQLTAEQAAAGLAGAIIVSDNEEQALTLPRAKRDQTLVIQDRYINGSNQFQYVSNPQGGFLGPHILVNDMRNAAMNVDTAVYRLRLLNGSNTRIYKLAWSNGMPVTVIGVDQGLLAAPVTRNYVMLSPGERVEVWADFRSLTVGGQVKLRSLAFTPGGPVSGFGLNQGAAFDIMAFNATTAVTDPITLPATLSTGVPNYTLAGATNYANPRVIPFSLVNGTFQMNGATFGMDEVAENEKPKLGEEQIWVFQNNASLQMPHPLHLHGSGFRVLERIQSGAFPTQVASMQDGFLDEGLKDTTLVMPGETIKLVHKPLFYSGLFLYHCHNLAHEDSGMMRNYRVLP
ncbi:MAG: multicopper oxidase family protein [Fimbriimonadaceae bacterium]|nr:multicopper oxidase family protein [Fimbriimonadaceae bacterium]